MKVYPIVVGVPRRRLSYVFGSMLAIATTFGGAPELKVFYRTSAAQIASGQLVTFRVGVLGAASTPNFLVAFTSDKAAFFASDGDNQHIAKSSLVLPFSQAPAPGDYQVSALTCVDSSGSTTYHRDGTVTFGENGHATHPMNFADYDFDVVSPGTSVSGSLSGDTTWTSAGSPYVLTSDVIVPYGVTLTITDGAVVTGGRNLEVRGKLNVIGSAERPVALDNIQVMRGSGTADQPSRIAISHAKIRGGALWPTNANSGYGSFSMTDSFVEYLTQTIYLWYPVSDCTFARNVFVESGGFSVGVGNGHASKVTIDNNTFVNANLAAQANDYSDSGAIVACWANDGGTINVNANSIYGLTKFNLAWVFKNPSLAQPTAAFNAANNYWDSLTPDDVSYLVLDSRRGRDYPNIIPYTPELTVPDPGTPPPPAAPTITAAPAPQLLAPGQSATLSASVAATPTATFQWKKDGVPIVGASSASLALTNFSPTAAGNYTVTVSDGFGTVTSAPASVSALTSWLTNVSVRAALQPGQPLIVGMATNGAKAVLLRAAGPGLRPFAIADAATDPALAFYPGGAAAPTATDDNWDASLSTTSAAVGAFPFTAGSKDAALLATVNGASSVVQTGSDRGVVLVEAYDTAAATFASRLINISARNFVGAGENVLIAGFSITGVGSKRLLVRGIGPGLAALGVAGTLADPKLLITPVGGGTVLAQNDDWDPSLTGTFTTTGAFGLPPGSKDAAVIVTLPPGIYSAQVSGGNGDTGVGLVEIYEAP